MKKLKFIFVILVLVISALPFFTVSAASTTVSVNKNFKTGDISGSELKYQFTIPTTDVKQVLGENGGTLTAGNVNWSGSGVKYKNIALTNYSPSENEVSGIQAIIKFEITDQENFTVTISSFVLNGTPKSTPTPTATATVSATVSATPTGSPENTPDGSPSASPTSSADVSPTPDGSPSASPTSSADVSPTPDGSPSASPTESATVTNTPTSEPKKTASPTRRPVISEPTKDPYNRTWETQAPPTLPPEVTMNPNEISTPVPEQTADVSHTPQTDNGDANSVRNFIFIVFLILVLLLAVDIYVISWRKQMGCGTLINNGISRRKVQDLYDYPETLSEDAQKDAKETSEQEPEQ